MIARPRRRLLSHVAAGIVLLAALAFAMVPTGAQEASPAASPVAETDLDERIGAISPEKLLTALLETPVDEDLFPSQYPDVVTEPWEDESDTDLDGVVGGVLVTSGETLLGVYIIHPSEEAATTRFENLLIEEATPFEGEQPFPPERVTVAGLPAWQINTDGIDEEYLVTLRLENMLISGAVGPYFETPTDEAPAATPVSAAETLAVTEAIVSHLDAVTADLAP